jgi:AAA domain
LAGRDVWILEDNDDAGRRKSLEAAAQLQSVAKTIRIVRLPGLADKQDVSDWLDTGHTGDELVEACRSSPLWRANTSNKRDFVLYDEISDRDIQKVMVVEGLFGLGEASCVYGKPGDGKSVGVEDLGLHVAAGRPWFGRITKQGSVLYVALERHKLVMRRALAFRKRYGLTKLPFAIAKGVHDFRDPKTAEKMVEYCRQIEEDSGSAAVLIIIDTLSRALCVVAMKTRQRTWGRSCMPPASCRMLERTFCGCTTHPTMQSACVVTAPY